MERLRLQASIQPASSQRRGTSALDLATLLAGILTIAAARPTEFSDRQQILRSCGDRKVLFSLIWPSHQLRQRNSRYVILESTGVGVTVMERSEPDEAWRTTLPTSDDVLRMPEIGIEIPVAEFY